MEFLKLNSIGAGIRWTETTGKRCIPERFRSGANVTCEQFQLSFRLANHSRRKVKRKLASEQIRGSNRAAKIEMKDDFIMSKT